MSHVIILNGKPRAGKDTAIGFMLQMLREHQIPVSSYSSIEPVKLMLHDWVDLSAKTEADRKLLATVGDALQEHSQFRTNQSLWMIDDFLSHRSNGVFFLHMREPALIELVRKGCKAQGHNVSRVLVENNRVPHITTNDADAGVRNMIFDTRLQNNTTLEDLERQCFQLLVHLRLI